MKYLHIKTIFIAWGSLIQIMQIVQFDNQVENYTSKIYKIQFHFIFFIKYYNETNPYLTIVLGTSLQKKKML